MITDNEKDGGEEGDEGGGSPKTRKEGCSEDDTSK
jgi:hypothetical protein